MSQKSNPKRSKRSVVIFLFVIFAGSAIAFLLLLGIFNEYILAQRFGFILVVFMGVVSIVVALINSTRALRRVLQNPLVKPEEVEEDKEESADTQVASKSDDPVLLSAWRQFIDYDAASNQQKETRTRIRSRIIWLGVVTSFVAVGVSIIVPASGQIDPAEGIIATIYNLYAGHWAQYKVFLQIVLAILPLLTTGLIAYAAEFSPTLAWAVYRIGAEMIRREIYLYRASAGPYSVIEENEKKAQLLDEHVKSASKLEKIYETDRIGVDNPTQREYIKQVLDGNATIPFIQQISDGNDQDIIPAIKHTTNRANQTYPPSPKWWQTSIQYLIDRIRFLLSPITFLPRSLMRFINEVNPQKKDPAIDRPSESKLDEDDGFSPLTTEKYVKYRLVPQLNWYSYRVTSDYYTLRVRKILILFFGGLGSLLVALSLIWGNLHLEIWVAVTSALVTALGLLIELKMYNHTYLIYNNTLSKLSSLNAEWKRQPKSDNASTSLIVRAEAFLQAEREEWMNRVIQSQTALEQKLAKSEGQSNRDQEGINKLGTPYMLKVLADSARYALDYKHANIRYQESLLLFRQDGNITGMLECLEGMLLVACARIATKVDKQATAHAEWVAKLYGAIAAVRNSTGIKSNLNLTQYEIAVNEARTTLGQKFDELQKQGATGPDVDTILRIIVQEALDIKEDLDT